MRGKVNELIAIGFDINTEDNATDIIDVSKADTIIVHTYTNTGTITNRILEIQIGPKSEASLMKDTGSQIGPGADGYLQLDIKNAAYARVIVDNREGSAATEDIYIQAFGEVT